MTVLCKTWHIYSMFDNYCSYVPVTHFAVLVPLKGKNNRNTPT